MAATEAVTAICVVAATEFATVTGAAVAQEVAVATKAVAVTKLRWEPGDEGHKEACCNGGSRLCLATEVAREVSGVAVAAAGWRQPLGGWLGVASEVATVKEWRR